MHMHVDETGRDNQAGCIKNFDVIRNRITVAGHANDAAVFDQKVLAGVDALRRIDHITVLDEQPHDLSFEFPLSSRAPLGAALIVFEDSTLSFRLAQRIYQREVRTASNL